MANAYSYGNAYGTSKQAIKQRIFRYFDYIWFIDSVNLCFIFILKEKNEKVWTFNIAHFSNFEISTSL